MKRKTMKNRTYFFSIQPVRSQKTSTKNVEAEGSVSLFELDRKIRRTMNYDLFDHVSAFYNGKPMASLEIATVFPDGEGENSDVTLDELGLSEGDKIGYVYDFGNNIQIILKLEDINPNF